jgi:hypothetical protein
LRVDENGRKKGSLSREDNLAETPERQLSLPLFKSRAGQQPQSEEQLVDGLAIWPSVVRVVHSKCNFVRAHIFDLDGESCQIQYLP